MNYDTVSKGEEVNNDSLSPPRERVRVRGCNLFSN